MIRGVTKAFLVAVSVPVEVAQWQTRWSRRFGTTAVMYAAETDKGFAEVPLNETVVLVLKPCPRMRRLQVVCREFSW